jgi:hypothetical protein
VNNLNSSLNGPVNRIIKPRRIKWTRHIARIGEMKIHNNILSLNMKERDLLGDLDLD